MITREEADENKIDVVEIDVDLSTNSVTVDGSCENEAEGTAKPVVNCSVTSSFSNWTLERTVCPLSWTVIVQYDSLTNGCSVTVVVALSATDRIVTGTAGAL